MRFLFVILLALSVAACGEKPVEPETDYSARAGSPEVSLMVADEAPARGASADPQQKIIRNGQLSVEVEDLEGAATAVREAVKTRGGRIESASHFSDERIHMRIRVPAEALDPTIADAFCDRLLHNAHRIELHGPSRRQEKKKQN